MEYVVKVGVSTLIRKMLLESSLHGWRGSVQDGDGGVRSDVYDSEKNCGKPPEVLYYNPEVIFFRFIDRSPRKQVFVVIWHKEFKPHPLLRLLYTQICHLKAYGWILSPVIHIHHVFSSNLLGILHVNL